MEHSQQDKLGQIAEATLGRAHVESATIFVIAPETGDLELAGAAGVEGPPLDRLAEAVRNPAHPIARTAAEGYASFDVSPMAPGGPALRSHVPILDARTGSVVGVLAVAHQDPLESTDRQALEGVAAEAALA